MEGRTIIAQRKFRLLGRNWLVFLVLCSAAAAQETELGTIGEIRGLSVAEAGEGRAVKVTGTVIFSRPKLATLFIHDGRNGIFVEQPTDYSGKGPKLGDRVELTGITGEGLYAPVIRGPEGKGAKVVILGNGDLPPPKGVTGEELSRPDMDCEWVLVSARVMEVMMNKDGVLLECRAGPCDFSVVLEGPISPDSVPWDLAESNVWIRGVAATAFNTSRQMTRRFVRVSALADIEPIQTAPTSEVASKLARVGELFRLSGPGPGELVKIRGTTTLRLPGRGLFLRTADGGMWIQTAQPVQADPGTIVEVEGWPRLGDIKPFLRSRVIRIAGTEPPPEPRVLNAREALRATNDAELVTVEGELLDTFDSTDGTTLVLRDSGVLFSGLLGGGEGTGLPKMEPGSRLRLTGIARISSSNFLTNPLQREDKLVIVLRTPGDSVLIATAPWWTTFRVATAAAIVFTAMLVIYAVARARRLREQDAKHREFEAVLAERGRFAREIHDSLAQGLTSISMQLECARDEIQEDAPKLRSHVETARRLVRDSLREARRTVWNLRPLALGEADLAGALQRYATDLARDGRVSCSQEIEGTPRPLPLEHEAALLRIGQEALTNATRHAAPSQLLLRLRFGAEWITLTVKDNGLGFDVAAKARKGFGLTGMQERVVSLGGSLSIDSILGEGTEVSATLPT